jgi:hypothetical protein
MRRAPLQNIAFQATALDVPLTALPIVVRLPPTLLTTETNFVLAVVQVPCAAPKVNRSVSKQAQASNIVCHSHIPLEIFIAEWRSRSGCWYIAVQRHRGCAGVGERADCAAGSRRCHDPNPHQLQGIRLFPQAARTANNLPGVTLCACRCEPAGVSSTGSNTMHHGCKTCPHGGCKIDPAGQPT